MKKNLFILFIVTIFITISCSDPIFYTISREQAPLKPRISGPSTNFVTVNNNTMYVASGTKLYSYNSGNWNVVDRGKRISQLAAVNDTLHELYDEDSSILGLDNYSVLKIYGVEDCLFISAKNLRITDDRKNKYSVFIRDSGGVIKEIVIPTTSNAEGKEEAAMTLAMLCGVVSDNDYFYLCSVKDSLLSNSGGILAIKKSTLSSAGDTVNSIYVEGTNTRDFAGIINLGSFTVAINRDGYLYYVTYEKTEPVVSAQIPDIRRSSGALGTWKDIEGNNLLLVGSQDISNSTTTGYTHGYMEIAYDDTSKLKGSLSEPGKEAISTVRDYELYLSSIGKHGVRFITQAPDGTLFASTNNGVWSYRNRDGLESWNAEE